MNTNRGPVFGLDFFPRPAIMKQIYRHLRNKSNIRLSAPRRVGKTSIMLELQHNPEPNFIFVYVFVQQVSNSEDFFKKILEGVLNTPEIGRLAQKIANLRNLLTEIKKHITEFEIGGVKIGLKEQSVNYQATFERLMRELDVAPNLLVLMIDEIPDAILHIGKPENGGEEAARKFLQICRDHRFAAIEQQTSFRFLYTGSTGLPNVVERFTSDNIIADVTPVEVPPLSKKEAIDFMQRLSAHAGVAFEPNAISYLLDRLQWLIPYHLKILFDEIQIIYDDVERAIGEADVEKAFKKLLIQRNAAYLNHYYERLFQPVHYPFAILMLEKLCQQHTLLKSEISTLAKSAGHNYRTVEESLGMLVYDGYIYENEQAEYCFTSALLREWWNKFANPNT